MAGPAEGLITNPKRLACLNCFLQMISVLSGLFFLFSGLAPIIFGLLFLASLPSWNEDTGLYALQFVGSLVLVCGTCFGCKALNSIRNDAASYSLDIRRARCTDDKDRKMLRAEMRGNPDGASEMSTRKNVGVLRFNLVQPLLWYAVVVVSCVLSALGDIPIFFFFNYCCILYTSIFICLYSLFDICPFSPYSTFSLSATLFFRTQQIS